MKTIKGIITGLIVLLVFTGKAQVSVNVNIGSPPSWGPVGYSDVQYYYLPDVEAYYDVQTSMFIYYGDGVWIRRASLPGRYRYYDLYSGYKVVLTDYRGNEPYIHFKDHKIKYYKGYKDGTQKTIGEKPGNGNNKSNNISDKQENKRSYQNNGKNAEQKNDNAGANGNERKSGGNGNQNGGSQGGGNGHQGGGNHGGGKKK